MSEAFEFHDRITGRRVRQLTNSTQRSVHGYYDIPPWSPDGSRLAFSRMDDDAREGDICVMDADGGQLRVVAHSRSMSANDGAMAQWAADGRRVYFKDREEHAPVIGWVDADTGERGFYPGDLRMMCPVRDEQAWHTAVGDMADHDVVERREEIGLFVQDLATGQSRCLATAADCLALHPRRDEIDRWHLFIKHSKWTPDGARLLFVFTNEIRFSAKFRELPRVKDVYVVNADGSGLKRVGQFGNHPSWHPAGQEVLSNSPFGDVPGNGLVLTDIDTGAERLATERIAGVGHPSFSPDGSHLVVDHVLGNEGYGSLNLVDLAADRVEHLVQVRVVDHSHVGTHLHPVWSRDGRQILYASDATGTAQLCVLDVA